MRTSRCIVTATLLLAAAAVGAQIYIPPHELKEEIPVLGVLPTFAPIEGEEGKAAAALIEAQLAIALRAAGFAVHDADAYRGIENEYRKLSGGWFDANTGKVDEAAREAVINRSMLVFLERHKLDGFVSAHVERHLVDFISSKRVTWDGVQEDLIAQESGLASLGRALGSGEQGRVSVMSLKLRMFNRRGQSVYEAMGGIGALSALVNKQFVEVDVPAILEDTTRISRAVRVALWPLTHEGEIAPVQLARKGETRTPVRKLPLAVAAAPAASLSRREIIEKVMTIALRPVEDPDHPKAQLVRAQYEAQLTSALAAGGFRVMPSAIYAQSLDASIRELGGIFDPISGALLAQKLERAHQIVHRKLREEHGVDAILNASFETTPAPYDLKGQASWDGATQSVFATPAGWNGKPYTGVQTAVSIAVKLTDGSGTQLYHGRGGIDLLSLYINGWFERRPAEELLLDSAKSAEGVRLALANLVAGP